PGINPMTTLTLSAGLPKTPKAKAKDAEFHGSTPAPSAERIPVSAGQGAVENMDDHSLLAATLAEDETAFAELHRRYKNQIINYVYRMLNDYERALDLAQETFL